MEKYPPTRYITISQENSNPFCILRTSFPKAKTGTTQKTKPTARRKYWNVLLGKYKTITAQYKDLILGKYGKVPGEVSQELIDACTKNGEKVITGRPADEIPAEMATLTEKVKADGFYEKEEDVLSYALFPEVSTNYFKWRKAKNVGVDTDMASNPNKVYPV